jgi:DNA polymerase I-like protein with 3'-5' exonuclease and polymerase domains
MNFFHTVSRPNVKTFFKPDPGYLIFDVDLAGADAQIVAWDAGDEPLKQAFRDYAAGKGPKVHCINSKAIFGDLAGPDGKKEPFYSQAKAGVHLTNYGGLAKTCAASLNVSLQRAEAFQRQWFKLHPAIKEWHHRVMRDLETTRTISNKFGFTRTFFDRINERLLPQALAWIPQSSVALIINYAYCEISENLPEIEILLQVHDSLTGQVPIPLWPKYKPLLREALAVTVPYDDPLIIPTSLKTSTVSWGDCKAEAWDD